MVAQGEASASRAQPWERVPITRSPEGRQSLRRNAVAEDPVEALEELLEAGVEDRVQWWVSRDFVGADGDEIEAARVQCLSVYEKTIAPIVGAWGPPDFRGSLTVDDGELVVPGGYPWSLCEF